MRDVQAKTYHRCECSVWDSRGSSRNVKVVCETTGYSRLFYKRHARGYSVDVSNPSVVLLTSTNVT